ncbi:hypothetical protein D3C78_1563160 [compost metagenome]
MAWVNVHLVSGWVALEQRLLAIGQVRLVLAHVCGSDHQDRFLRRVRVDRLVAGKLHVVPARYFTQVFARVRWNSALCVTGLFSADTGQLLAEFRRLVRRYLRQGTTCQAGIDGYCSYEHHAFCFYIHALAPSQTSGG